MWGVKHPTLDERVPTRVIPFFCFRTSVEYTGLETFATLIVGFYVRDSICGSCFDAFYMTELYENRFF